MDERLSPQESVVTSHRDHEVNLWVELLCALDIEFVFWYYLDFFTHSLSLLDKCFNDSVV